MTINVELWLETYYPKDGTCILERGMDKNYGKKREEVNVLYLTANIDGKAKLPGFVNLEMLESDCWQFEGISLIDCPKLKSLYIVNGEFKEIDLSKNFELTEVKIKKWKAEIDLSIFSHLKKLEKLDLEDSNFSGSLESLKDCKELKYLNIGGNKKITQGLEFLPEDLKLEHRQFLGSGIAETLSPFDYKFEVWKTDYKKKLKKKDFKRPAMVGGYASVVGESKTENCLDCKGAFKTHERNKFRCLECQWNYENEIERQKGKEFIEELENNQAVYDRTMEEIRRKEREEKEQLFSQNTTYTTNFSFLHETKKEIPVELSPGLEPVKVRRVSSPVQFLAEVAIEEVRREHPDFLSIKQQMKLLEEKVEQLTRELAELRAERRNENEFIARIEILPKERISKN